MHKLPLSFILLTYTGYWRPIKWPVYSIQYWLYNTYSALMILFLYFFAFCSFVDSVLSEDLKAATDKFSLFISVLGVCIKVGNLFFQRKRIISLMNTLVQGNCIPRDEQEMIIQQKSDDHARNLTIYCEIVNQMAATFATLGRFNELLGKRSLPVYDWVPYSLTSQNVYMISLMQQTLALIICANASVANETLISGLMIQTSAQFEIFCHRARKLPALFVEAEKASTSTEELKNRRKRILRNLITHHLEIYDLEKYTFTVIPYKVSDLQVSQHGGTSHEQPIVSRKCFQEYTFDSFALKGHDAGAKFKTQFRAIIFKRGGYIDEKKRLRSFSSECLTHNILYIYSVIFVLTPHYTNKCPVIYGLRGEEIEVHRNAKDYWRAFVKTFTKIVNAIFQYTIFLQFCISTTVLCLSILKMSSKLSFDVNFVSSLFYLCAMLMQVYLYCWFGNEVTLKSKSVSDAIYEMDWTTLPVNVMKDLLIIMMRSKRPIVMSSGHIVTLSTDSFVTIMKTSYSSYNLLKDPSKA
ncbi:uncharacterized protein LOC143153021 [Ptiloglossa arizonensis]|uniref:uncharacterized protein LOC143153021 n=1 Tax=Ptiloglossa arizonensis TaxID=3350558 RepID=UPI003FA04B00